jgi:chromatin remodeling complex protein RSC6
MATKSTKKTAAKKAAPKKAAAKAPAPKKRKVNPALMKPVQPDDVLAAVVGNKPAPRGQITKKLWDYIKKNGLQDAKNKRQINADDALKAVFGGKKSVTMFEMTKLVSKHIK